MSELELAKYPGLYQRGGVWYVRKRVPKDLIHVDTRGQIRLSLETSNRKDAVDLYPVKMAEITLGFKKLREQVGARRCHRSPLHRQDRASGPRGGGETVRALLNEALSTSTDE